MGTKPETDFNTIQFEKRLQSLKDSQDSINNCCHWCLENHQHHKKIVNSWLNVLKRVRIEQRLTLFYLANDVIQYSKRRNLEFVESWSTTLQKATTMVRDEKIKHKILRIFKIWEQRCIYGEEFLTDLCGLISATPTRKNDEPQEFQAAYLITKIKGCSKLEQDTDLKLKKFKEHNPKMMDCEALCSSLKDRAHVDDVEKEMDDYVSHMEVYVNALKLEIKARHNLISLLQQAEQHLDKDKKDVKTVEKAYKVFALKVKDQKKHLEELIPRLVSPVPSPDINAPSPSPDSDLELPPVPESPPKESLVASLYQKAGFYNPVPPPTTEASSFINNGFSSFMGGNMPFNVSENMNSVFGNQQQQQTVVTTTQSTTSNTHSTSNYTNALSSLFPSLTQPPPPPDTPAPLPVAPPNSNFSYNTQQVPLMPPPLPPFCKSDSYSSSSGYNDSYGNDSGSSSYINNSYVTESSYLPNTNFQSNPSYTNAFSPTFNTSQNSNSFGDQSNLTFPPLPPPNLPNYTNDEYNPEEEPETWDAETSWDQPPVDLETPESPPMFEKEAFGEPVEYHEAQPMGRGSMDVDHRILNIPEQSSVNELGHRKTDIDHRNLISLTGSPKEGGRTNSWTEQGDQDYRKEQTCKDNADQDYRIPFTFDALKLPPPPPPPNNQLPAPQKAKKNISPRKGVQDNVESIDMDLSDDDPVNENLKIVHLVNSDNDMLDPPPPFPEFSDEADANANNLLDDLNNELDEGDLLSGFEEEDDEPSWEAPPPMMGGPPLQQGGLLPPPPMNWIGVPLNNNFPNGRGRGYKWGNFSWRGDFRGGRRSRGGWKMRGGFNGGRGGVQRRPFFRWRFRGGPLQRGGF